MIRAIVGANWGDEGKGKITDMCADQSDIVVRFQGGANAGHTIINEHGRFALHQLPSGVFHEHITNVIANGVALNVDSLMKEMKTIEDAGIKFNLLISERAQVLMPHHVLMDTYEEERLGDKKFGSTKSGIAPFYSDKYSKFGSFTIRKCLKKSFRDYMKKLIFSLSISTISLKLIIWKFMKLFASMQMQSRTELQILQHF